MQVQTYYVMTCAETLCSVPHCSCQPQVLGTRFKSAIGFLRYTST